MLVLRLHYNLIAFTPTVEFCVHSEIAFKALQDLVRDIQDGALKTVEIEEPNGSHYTLKPRMVH